MRGTFAMQYPGARSWSEYGRSSHETPADAVSTEPDMERASWQAWLRVAPKTASAQRDSSLALILHGLIEPIRARPRKSPSHVGVCRCSKPAEATQEGHFRGER